MDNFTIEQLAYAAKLAEKNLVNIDKELAAMHKIRPVFIEMYNEIENELKSRNPKN